MHRGSRSEEGCTGKGCLDSSAIFNIYQPSCTTPSPCPAANDGSASMVQCKAGAPVQGRGTSGVLRAGCCPRGSIDEAHGATSRAGLAAPGLTAASGSFGHLSPLLGPPTWRPCPPKADLWPPPSSQRWVPQMTGGPRQSHLHCTQPELGRWNAPTVLTDVKLTAWMEKQKLWLLHDEVIQLFVPSCPLVWLRESKREKKPQNIRFQGLSNIPNTLIQKRALKFSLDFIQTLV